MFKVFRNFSSLQACCDFTLSLGLWCLISWLRFTYFPNAQLSALPPFFYVSPFLASLTIYFFYKNELYNERRFPTKISEISSIFRAKSWAMMSFIIGLYFVFPERFSRSVLLTYFGASVVSLVVLRLCFRNILRLTREKGKNLRRGVLIGDGPLQKDYKAVLRKFKDSGTRIIGEFETSTEQKHFEGLDQARKLYGDFEFIVLAFSNEKALRAHEIIKGLETDMIDIEVIPDTSYAFVGHNLEDFDGLPLLSINKAKLRPLDQFFKRLLDLLIAGPGLVFILPLLVPIAILIKLSSRGPLFYGQERVGLDGQKFLMWKFRSMKVATKESTPGWTVENDPRRTKIGTFLRSTSMDELPQLWNVLKGDMSIVGPRPEQSFFVEKFKQEIPGYMQRHKMKAGLTGWAQVNGLRGDTSIKKRIDFDIYYIKNWSIIFDIKIIFLTFWKGLLNKNAY